MQIWPKALFSHLLRGILKELSLDVIFFYRIDLPCPRGWWGNPICGPCNCETSKGFDPDCNKTNGECHCKVSKKQQSEVKNSLA